MASPADAAVVNWRARTDDAGLEPRGPDGVAPGVSRATIAEASEAALARRTKMGARHTASSSAASDRLSGAS